MSFMDEHQSITERLKKTLAISLTTGLLFLNGCARPSRPTTQEIRVLIDSPPATLEPRQALDATGQRIDMLLFRALTSVGSDLKLNPDLATRWWTDAKGRRWVFEIPADSPVSAQALASCIQNYLSAKPESPLRSSFPSLAKVTADANHVNVDLQSPDPFFPRNVSLFRFYIESGQPGPCLPIVDEKSVVASGDYEMRPFQKNPEREIVLHSRTNSPRPTLRFIVTKDDTARIQKLLTNEADVAQNPFTAARYQWLRKNNESRFRFLDQGGVNVSYLAFQLQDPILSVLKVRQAIAHAIDRESIIQFKMPGTATLAGSFLSPHLPGAHQSQINFNSHLSEKLLDEAGYPRKSGGIRFRLKYKTTPRGDGFETALILQEMLRKVGIGIDLEAVEPAVFFASIRKGNFQLYSSRWVGVSDESIFYRTLSSESADNRIKYRSPEMTAWVGALKVELDANKRLALTEKIQKKMAEDLPYFPLWFWTNTLILRKELTGLEANQVSLSGSFVPLSFLRWSGSVRK